MPGKRVQFDDETWQALHQLALDRMASFQELADEAFADLLRKHNRPVGFRAALTASARKAEREGKSRSSKGRAANDS
jgi:hypothetical protein